MQKFIGKFAETYKTFIAYTEMEIDIIKQTLIFSDYKVSFCQTGSQMIHFS